MTDNFFKNHELSLWIFAVGVLVIMTILIGGGIAVFLLTIILERYVGYFSIMEYFALAGIFSILMVLITSIANLLIIKGKPRAKQLNIINIYFQIVCYLLFAMTFEHEDKWLGVLFGVLPLLSLWLMSTQKYHAFVAYYEALYQDPAGFREKLLQRLNNS
ncbi:hypothetical protein [Vibrio tapetis]|uniref:Uncharacterized protein n=1 Tax=Vibrio tapetis subsp. tapetis TaxID=1671868 RepID=A0A2N8ZJB3_9VIBR|nr:hypothetical protein [Vibrio tapetis]SON51977.1 conserved membrane protein of unknown function [Vibrio tapetis subsp. tapetis]